MVRNIWTAICLFSLQSCLQDREFAPPVVPAPSGSGFLVINEIAPNESPDWVEIVNPGSLEIRLKAGEYFFSDDTSNRTKDTLKTDVIIPGKAYLLVECNPSSPLPGSIPVTFNLSSTNGESFGIYHRMQDGRIENVSEVFFPSGIMLGNSFARRPDLTGPFEISTNQSKGSSNP